VLRGAARDRYHQGLARVEHLRQDGEQVLYPQLPDPDRPSLETWQEVVHAELAQLGSGQRIVIAHSLAVSLWLYLASALTATEKADRVLLVSPPSPNFLRSQDKVAAFAGAPLDAEALRAAAGTTRLVCSDNDPYCPETAPVAYAALNLPVDIIAGGGHIDPDAGYGVWPSAAEWCRDEVTRITRRP
jgi:predicted alpha/beta hydrolase family esterase